MVGLRKIGEDFPYNIGNFVRLYEGALSGRGAESGMQGVFAGNKGLLLFPTVVTNPQAPWASGGSLNDLEDAFGLGFGGKNVSGKTCSIEVVMLKRG